jgi:hypothetical protein
VRLLHSLARTHASFDDPHLVSRAGLVPVVALAQRAGLPGLVAEQVTPGGPCCVNAPVKIGCLVAGMVAGADSIEDMDLLRHGAMDALFGGIRAPSTLGSHLRCYTWGNVRQLEAVIAGCWRSWPAGRRCCPARTCWRGQAVTARLLVRRVRDLNRKAAAGQDELFSLWRHHAVFTDSPFQLVQAEEQHRDHAVVEQVFADVTNGPLAHLPSGSLLPMRPGRPAPPSRTTCCAPPDPWPASPAPGRAAPRCAAT